MAMTLEERVGALEAKLAQLLEDKGTNTDNGTWWQQRYGAFKNDELYDEAMRLGAEYRRAQPTAADEIEALEKADQSRFIVKSSSTRRQTPQ